MHPYDLIFAGLALDVMGAVVLAKSFILKKPQDAFEESLMLLGGNNLVLRSALAQSSEARVGAGLLLSGFLLQMWGNLHGGIAATETGWVNSVPRMAVVLGGAFALAVTLLFLAGRQWRRDYYRVMIRNNPTVSWPKEGEAETVWCDRAARMYDLKRRRGESDEELRQRLVRRREGLEARFWQSLHHAAS